MTGCDHEKVFEQGLLASCPPQQNWICRKCKTQGRSVFNGHYPSRKEQKEFDSLFKSIIERQEMKPEQKAAIEALEWAASLVASEGCTQMGCDKQMDLTSLAGGHTMLCPLGVYYSIRAEIDRRKGGER